MPGALARTRLLHDISPPPSAGLSGAATEVAAATSQRAAGAVIRESSWSSTTRRRGVEHGRTRWLASACAAAHTISSVPVSTSGSGTWLASASSSFQLDLNPVRRILVGGDRESRRRRRDELLLVASCRERAHHAFGYRLLSDGGLGERVRPTISSTRLQQPFPPCSNQGHLGERKFRRTESSPTSVPPRRNCGVICPQSACLYRR